MAGKFIVIDGTDGSGKGTQFELLKERMVKEGLDLETVDFPRYDEPSSYFVTRYLNGAYGSKEDVAAKEASLFYALDRYEAKAGIKEALSVGKTVLANRFTSSNMGLQGAKIKDASERIKLFEWLDELEHEILKIPRPDCVIVLDVPGAVAQANVDKKQERTYTKKKRDIHEADATYLHTANETYKQLCELYPKQFVKIDCMRNDTQMRSESEIHNLIWQVYQQKTA
ncbi:MAG TPA: dTMP kinase [Candidatus Saccharimonadales bacterium]|nr:dTMP kinase [Candidatus Saccharimonadales bacterium]